MVSYAAQRVTLSVAAAVAYNFLLTARPLKFYDAIHLTDTLDYVATALSKVARLQVREGGAPREAEKEQPPEG